MDYSYINPPDLLDIIDNGLKGRPRRPPKVLVLGAGLAGLVSASELLRAGYDVRVVEARNRVGGRIMTLREPFSNGLYGEAGAMRIPSCHELVMRYVNKFELPVRPFRSSNDNAWCFIHHERSRMSEVMANPSIGIGNDAGIPEGSNLGLMWADALEPLYQILRDEPQDGWARLADLLQDISLYEFLKRAGWSDSVIEMYGLLAGFETLLFASAFEFVREFILGLRDHTVAITGGMDQLANAFLPDLRGRIQYSSPVCALDQDENGVIVTVRRKSGTQTLKADFAICTLPLPVLRHIEIWTPFSRAKQRAIRSVHYEAATKIFFEMGDRFWETEDDIWGGASVTDLPIRNTYYPEHGRQTGRGVLLASYSHGQDAHRWGALSDDMRLLEAMENLAELHPQASESVEGGYSVCWSLDPFAGGAYSFFQPHQEALLHDSIIEPEGHYYFAGEHASLQHRWLQGAVESALVAIRDIHTLVMKDQDQATQIKEPKLTMFDNDPAAIKEAAKDFGGIFHCEPRYVVRPRHVEDVAAAVRYARENGMGVVAQGVGHSAGGQSQVEGGIAIDMTTLRDIRSIDVVNNQIDADAGVRWREMMDALVPLGRTLQVITDWMHLTLGGTTTAGGVGAQSFRRGIQADLIESMTVVTGTGEIVECSREKEPDLFFAVRGGLGQFGIITSIKMQLVSAPETVLLNHMIYDDLALFCSDVERMMAEDSGVEGLLCHAVGNSLESIAISQTRAKDSFPVSQSNASGRWVYDLEVTRYPNENGEFPPLLDGLNHIPELSIEKEQAYEDYISRVPPIVERDAREGAAPHPEAALFVPHSEAPAFFQETMENLPVEDMGGGPVLIIPIDRRHLDSSAFRIPDEDKSWLFGLLRAARSPEDVERLGRDNLAHYQKGIALGANRYPCDSLQEPSDNASWAKHFGKDWPRLLALKKRYDPDGILAPRLGIRPE
jgi:monoamine oxidase